MGLCHSNPSTKSPNPYAARKDAPEYSDPRKTTSPPREAQPAAPLVKTFGLPHVKIGSRYQVGEEVGRGRLGYTCSAIANKGELKGQQVAIKIFPKSKMTNAIAIENVKREIKILRCLTGHPNIVEFHDAFEDAENVYIVMEFCRGGKLLDRGEKCSEDNAKTIIVQILEVLAFCHLQGVVHLDVRPENFLFTTEDEDSPLKISGFGLSEFVGPDTMLNDIVGTTCYVAPEVLHRSYDTQADVWSVGLIAYIVLCGNRPFSDQMELRNFKPNFEEEVWSSLSCESKNFVQCLLHEDPKRRITSAQALCHPWLLHHNQVKLPLDILTFKLMRAYVQSSTLRRAALRALSKTLTGDELYPLKEQYALLCLNESGGITLNTISAALERSATDAMKESCVLDYLASLNVLQYRKMYFEEFCAAALSVHQLEALGNWEQRASSAYEIFEKEGNRAIVIQELESELGLAPVVTVHSVLQEWIRRSDGKLCFRGFLKLLLHCPSN